MNAATSAVELPTRGKYQIDTEQSTVHFTTRHLFGLGGVRGRLALRDGELTVAERVTDAWVRASVDATSFTSGNGARDAAVRSARFLDTNSFPDIDFVSTEVKPAEGGWAVRGELTVRTITSAVVLQMTDLRWDDTHLRFDARTKVDRFEAGISAARGLAARYLDMHVHVVATKVDPSADPMLDHLR